MGGTAQDDSVDEDELNCGGGTWDGHGLWGRCACVCACMCACGPKEMLNVVCGGGVSVQREEAYAQRVAKISR